MTVKVRHFLDLPLLKKNNQAIFLGCGPSILDINDSFLEKLEKLDVWTSNR